MTCDTMPKGRQDHNVNLWVPKEPQNVLVKNGIPTAGRIKESRAEVAVRQQHGDRAGQNRQGQEDQPRGHKD